MSLDTVCRSMNSDMSRRTIACGVVGGWVGGGGGGGGGWVGGGGGWGGGEGGSTGAGAGRLVRTSWARNNSAPCRRRRPIASSQASGHVSAAAAHAATGHLAAATWARRHTGRAHAPPRCRSSTRPGSWPARTCPHQWGLQGGDRGRGGWGPRMRTSRHGACRVQAGRQASSTSIRCIRCPPLAPAFSGPPPPPSQRPPTREDERGDGAVGVLEADAGAADGAGDGGHGLLLPNHAAVQHLLHLHQPLGLVRGDLRGGAGGDAGGLGGAAQPGAAAEAGRVWAAAAATLPHCATCGTPAPPAAAAGGAGGGASGSTRQHEAAPGRRRHSTLPLAHLLNGDAGPLRHNVGNVLLRHHGAAALAALHLRALRVLGAAGDGGDLGWAREEGRTGAQGL